MKMEERTETQTYKVIVFKFTKEDNDKWMRFLTKHFEDFPFDTLDGHYLQIAVDNRYVEMGKIEVEE